MPSSEPPPGQSVALISRPLPSITKELNLSPRQHQCPRRRVATRPADTQRRSEEMDTPNKDAANKNNAEAAPAPTSFSSSSTRTIAPASTRAASTPAFRPSPTATSTSVTPSPSASTSAWPGSSAAGATCASTTPIPPRKSRNTSMPSWPTSAGSALPGTASTTPPTTSSSSTSGPAQLIQTGKAYVCDLSADEVARTRGTLTEPARKAPTATALSRRTSICSAHEGRRVCRRRAPCGPRSTWPRPTSTCATRLCIASSSAPPPHRRQVVHLSDVRLGPRAVRLH